MKPKSNYTCCDGADQHASTCQVPGDRFTIKDSGERQIFSTGMQRDSGQKTLRPDLIWTPGLVRLAEHMGKGALKYSDRNWEKASTQEELDRFRASAFRHFLQWFKGDRDEDHLSATIFNLFGAEMVNEKLKQAKGPLAF